MKKLFLAALLMLGSAAAFGQVFSKADTVFDSGGHPVPNAIIHVCQLSSSGLPCSPSQAIYKDYALTQPINQSSSPLATDAGGNYIFYTTTPVVDIQITSRGITHLSQNVILAGNSVVVGFNVSQFTGATADVQISAAVSAACASSIHAVNLWGMSKHTIAATTPLGCADGTPLVFSFDPAYKFTPTMSTTNMFTWLPSASSAGCLSADVTGSAGYSGNVLALIGYTYDNQPGNISVSQGQTAPPCLNVFGGGNSTGTAVYLSGTNNLTEYIEYVKFGSIAVSGMLYGVHAVTSGNGWINSNRFDAGVRCSSTIHCFTPDTTDANGNFVGNGGYVEIEFSTTFPTQTLDGFYLKGLGSISNNSFTFYSWDFANCASYPVCATIRVDTSIAHNFGNVFNGQVDYPQVEDTANTLNGFDTLNSEYFGLMNNASNGFIGTFFRTNTPANGFMFNSETVLSSDNLHNTIIDSIDSTGNVYLRTNNNRWFLTHDGNAILSIGGVTKALIDPSGNATFNGNGAFLGKLTIGGVDDISSFGVIDAGKLGATTGEVPVAALGSGSPGSGTALFGDQSYKQTPITTGTPVAGNTTCWVNATTLGKCTSVVGAGGTCTCASN